jgi:hypothetical protein
MGARPAARPQDYGSGQRSGWAAADLSGPFGCAGGVRAPPATEPWAPALHRRGPSRAAAPVRTGVAPPRPAAALPHAPPRAAAAAPGPAAAPPGQHAPAADAGPPGAGSPAATPPAAPRTGGPLPARKQG